MALHNDRLLFTAWTNSEQLQSLLVDDRGWSSRVFSLGLVTDMPLQLHLWVYFFILCISLALQLIYFIMNNFFSQGYQWLDSSSLGIFNIWFSFWHVWMGILVWSKIILRSHFQGNHIKRTLLSGKEKKKRGNVQKRKGIWPPFLFFKAICRQLCNWFPQ